MKEAFDILKSLGVEARDIEAILDSVPVREAIIQKAQEVEEYWKSIAPEGPYSHVLASGHVDDPGDYRRSIRIKFTDKPGELFTAIVKAYDYKAYWLEYGSAHNVEHGYAQKTVDHFGGETVSEAESILAELAE